MSLRLLSPAQSHALLDILTHHEVYSEIEVWKSGDTVRDPSIRRSSSPLLQHIFNHFVVTLPGIRTLPMDFWQNKAGSLLANLSDAELSESFDKGHLGTRKTLSTAHSVIIENIARGLLGGCPAPQGSTAESGYDRSNFQDLERAWKHAVHGIVYGDLIDELYDGFSTSDRLEDLSPLIQAALKHIFLILASFTHHVFVLSPGGQDILQLLISAHKMIPYVAIKQVLRVGNAASMVNGVIKLVLTKLSLKAVTNWMGLSKGTNDGMNLLQQIISTVLARDSSEFEETISRISKARDGLSKEHLDAIEKHIESYTREHHEKLRLLSIQQSKSIVNIIFENSYKAPTSLSEAQHKMALEYYAARLSLRDRKEIARVLCRQHPDNLTQSIRNVVAVYEPLIRSVHRGVDLSAAVSYAQDFLEDLIKTVNSRSGNIAPSVEDFTYLFRRHVGPVFKILHQVAGNCPDWVATWREWCKKAALNFRREDPLTWEQAGAAGSLTEYFTTIFSSIPDDRKPAVLSTLDAHATYLAKLSELSSERAQSILDSNYSTMRGPGVYLARWHSLLNMTLVTPATAEGPVRRGREIQIEERANRIGKRKESWDSAAVTNSVMAEAPEEPDVELVLKLFGKQFRELLSRELAMR